MVAAAASSSPSPAPYAAAGGRPHPTYTKMITQALTELGGASRRGAIAARIRGRGYSGLPARHDELLSAHLRCLLAEGVLRLHADSPSTYIFAAPKPTPMSAHTGGIVAPSAAKRKLPPLPGEDATMSPEESGNNAAAAGVERRGRGRPRKVKPVAMPPPSAASPSRGFKRGCGRPSPLLSVVSAATSYGNKEWPPEAKRGRGRPRKNPPATAMSAGGATASKWVKGGRGRPPKKKLAPLPQGYKRRRGRPINDQYYFRTAAGEVLAA